MPRVTATGICERAEFAKIVMTKFLYFGTCCVASWYHAEFSAHVCGEKNLNMQWGFLFHELPAICHEKDLCVFYCGPFCKTVRFSLLVISAAIQKERKDRGSVLSWFGFITSCRVGSSNGRALPQDADRVHTV